MPSSANPAIAAVTGIKDMEIRVYDGSSPDRHYVVFFQLDPPTLPMMVPRPATTLKDDGGRATDFMVSYIDTAAELTPFEPIETTFRLMHMSQALQLVDALGNPFEKENWIIGAHTWNGLATSALGTRKNSDGVNIACRYPKDVPQQTRMVSIVWGYNVPADAPAGTAIFCEAKGVVTSNVMNTPEGALSYFEFTTQIWGEINPRLTDWPDGIESIPS